MTGEPNEPAPKRIDWSKCKALTTASEESITISRKGNADETTALLHHCILASCQYSVGAQRAIYDGNGESFKRELLDTATNHVISIFQRMNPQDPMEEMLLTQAIVTHARMLWLNKLAMNQEQRSNLQAANEAADRAANTYRRQMLALREYRRPSKTFIAVRQTNMANQQVVQNGFQETENATNEQESTNTGPTITQALPDDSGRIDPLAGIHRQREAVVAEHRPDDTGGQSPIQDERMEARRAKRSANGRAAGADGNPADAAGDDQSRQ